MVHAPLSHDKGGMVQAGVLIVNSQSSLNCLRPMWDKALAWAKAQTPAGSNHRRNAVHGEEEIKIVLNERFRAQQTEEEEVNQQGNMQYEAGYINYSVARLRMQTEPFWTAISRIC